MTRHPIIAISPCPNDIYTYAGLLSNEIPNSYQFTIRPIGALNQIAQLGKADIVKISAGTYPFIKESYRLTAVGASFGIDRGPKVVCLPQNKGTSLHNREILTPGQTTTAARVLSHLFPTSKQREVGLFELPRLVAKGEAPFGVVINESVHELAQYGLIEIIDLAKAWQQSTGQPLPLGLVVIKKELSAELESQFTLDVQNSITWARSNPQKAIAFAQMHSHEKDPQTIMKHVDAFTQQTTGIGNLGLAIQEFERITSRRLP